MPTGKTSTLTIRLDPDLKEALRAAADHEHRSIANMVEVLIRDHCGRCGIAVDSLSKPPAKSSRADTRAKRT